MKRFYYPNLIFKAINPTLAFIVLIGTISNISYAGTPFAEFVDPNPNPGNQFGASIVVLSTGNVVITAPYDDAGGSDAGAIYLFSGATGALISSLKGSKASDRVGSSGVTVLSNGNYVVRSPLWDNGAAVNAGAVTWGNGYTGVSGVVNSSNSLIGSAANDSVGSTDVTVLSNGNYVIRTPSWDNGPATDAGAVTWGSGTTGVSGVISSSNSLIGAKVSDQVGNTGVTVLNNNNYVIRTPNWDNGPTTDAGAVTWGSGTTGVSGVVSSSNSLTGSKVSDQVGSGLTLLSNGNYVVISRLCDNGNLTDAGAVTWGSGTTGVSGVVSSSNSLVGSTASDEVGSEGVTTLTNGNYVVRSKFWDNGTLTDTGAVTWGNGTTGISGTISSNNSLVGSTVNEQVGSEGVKELSNGNYVVISWFWDNGAVIDAGAVTWGSGITGVSGTISSSNSLVGSTASDKLGNGGVTALSNGNYVVVSWLWDNGTATDAGAVTWGNGTTGISGTVSSSNSLVGTTTMDQLGNNGLTVLPNGNYVVSSPFWNNYAGAVTWGQGTIGVSGAVNSNNSLVGERGGAIAGDVVGYNGVTVLRNGNYVVRSDKWEFNNAGAVTWGNGNTGVNGVVSSSNSLVGSQREDNVGSGGIIELTNSNYVVISPSWDGSTSDVGAVTWGSGINGVSGIVSSSNSLVGSKHSDKLGNGGVTALSNGNYVVRSDKLDNGTATDAGAVTWGSGTTGVSGVVSSSNSLVGTTASDQVGNGGVLALPNGNYVVRSSSWNNGAAAGAGAVSWGNGNSGISGTVSRENSLVGSKTGDTVGSAITVLSNSNYVVSSLLWDNGPATNAGAVTWGSGATGVSGTVSIDNSLIGSKASDLTGSVVTALNNGNYVVRSSSWDNGPATDAGAVTWGSGNSGVSGIVSSGNSLVGLTSNTMLQAVVVDDANSTYFGWFRDEGSGKIRLGSQFEGPAVPTPTITSVSPSSGSTFGGTSITITGTNLSGVIGVTIGGVPTTSLSANTATSINCVTTVGTEGVKDVVVTTAGGASTGGIGLFTYLSRNADLSSLNVGGGNLTPPFSFGTTNYATVVPNATSTLSFSATASHPGALLGGSTSPLILSVGANTLTIIVTAEDGLTTQSYTVAVTRQTVFETSLSTWSSSYNLSAATSGPTDDPDGDGVSNFLEFAFGTIPSSNGSGPTPLKYTGTLAGEGIITATGQPMTTSDTIGLEDNFCALYVRRADHASIGLTYTPQFSNDLLTWENSAAPPNVLANNGLYQIVSVPFTPVLSNEKKVNFFRLIVSSN